MPRAATLLSAIAAAARGGVLDRAEVEGLLDDAVRFAEAGMAALDRR